MKRLNFSESQKNIIREIVEVGFKDYENTALYDIRESLHQKLNNKIFALDKHEFEVLNSFTKNWINKNSELILIIHEKFYSKNPNQYLLLDKTHKNLIDKIDTVNSIKEMLTGEKHFFYKSVFDKINMIKTADKFYISFSNNKPYKVAVVNKNKVLNWELTNNNIFEEINFIKLPSESILKKNYMKSVNTNELREILENSEYVDSEQSVEFLQNILS